MEAYEDDNPFEVDDAEPTIPNVTSALSSSPTSPTSLSPQIPSATPVAFSPNRPTFPSPGSHKIGRAHV